MTVKFLHSFSDLRTRYIAVIECFSLDTYSSNAFWLSSNTSGILFRSLAMQLEFAALLSKQLSFSDSLRSASCS